MESVAIEFIAHASCKGTCYCCCVAGAQVGLLQRVAKAVVEGSAFEATFDVTRVNGGAGMPAPPSDLQALRRQDFGIPKVDANLLVCVLQN